MKTGHVVDKYGNQEWYVDGQLHRLDGPAVVWRDGLEITVPVDQ